MVTSRSLPYPLLGLALTGLILLGIIGLAARTVRSFYITADSVLQSQEVRLQLGAAGGHLKEFHLATRSYLQSGDERFLPTRDQGLINFRRKLPELRRLMVNSPAQQRSLASLEDLVVGIEKEYERFIGMRRAGQEAAIAAQATEAKRLGDEIIALMSALQAEETRLLETRVSQARREAAHTVAVMISGVLLAFVLMGAVIMMWRREMRARTLADRRLAAQAAELEEANRELEAFSYSVSHDLRAPLRHIDYFSAMLPKHVDAAHLDDKARRYLATISASARSMGQLIDDLLGFARIGRAEMRRVRVDLNALVNETRQSLDPEVNGRPITWAVAQLPGLEGDAALLRQVFVNLIGNAVKYTRHREQTRIEIGVQAGKPDEAVIFVRDNGAGFDMQYAEKLFGVFQRLHTAAEFEGTGVGLANVRRIIQRHGGRTWAEGAVDAGATFYFSLPIARNGT